MSEIGLTSYELNLIRGVLSSYTRIREAILYGSRAKGVWKPESDIDLALLGLEDALQAEFVAESLEELPLPYRFDVKALEFITHAPLLDHIARVGITVYLRRGQDTPEDGDVGG